MTSHRQEQAPGSRWSRLPCGRCLPLLLGVVALLYGSLSCAQLSEPQLRAGVIVAILRYTQWPRLPEKADLTVCSVGESPGFKTLASARANITVAGKSLTLKTPTSADQQRHCQVVIIGAGASTHTLAAIRQASLLSICDTCDNPGHHAVSLFMHNQRIRFSVNLIEAQSAGIRFSASMLELAAEVEG